jgi:hypothetical protein
MDDDWSARATPAHTRPQLRRLLHDRRLPEGAVIPPTCQWLGCNEHCSPMIQYWKCRAEIGYARNAGPADTARMLAAPLRKSGVQELRPSLPAQHTLGRSGRRCGRGQRYIDIAPGKFRSLKRQQASRPRLPGAGLGSLSTRFNNATNVLEYRAVCRSRPAGA